MDGKRKQPCTKYAVADCHHGPECWFDHDAVDKLARAQGVCFHYLRKHCRHGAAGLGCTHKHTSVSLHGASTALTRSRDAGDVLSSSLASMSLLSRVPGATMVPVKVQAERKLTRELVDLLLYIDVSGSMVGARIKEVKRAVKELYEELSGADSVTLKIFSRKLREVVPITHKRKLDDADFIEMVDNLECSGGTALWDAVIDSVAASLGAFKWSNERHHQHGKPKRYQKVVICTDGEDTASNARYTQALQALQKPGRPSYNTFILAVGEATKVEEIQTLNRNKDVEIINAEDAHEIAKAFRKLREKLYVTTTSVMVVPVQTTTVRDGRTGAVQRSTTSFGIGAGGIGGLLGSMPREHRGLLF